MNRRELLQTLPAAAILNVVAARGNESVSTPSTTVYELRVYHAYEGRLDDLLRRFREHTVHLFEKHGMKNVAYWTPTDEPMKSSMLIYVLGHASREAATASWKAFHEDPEWQKVRDASEAHGQLVEKNEATFLALTDFSPPVM